MLQLSLNHDLQKFLRKAADEWGDRIKIRSGLNQNHACWTV